jgi:osmotically-inducible protein OsmY
MALRLASTLLMLALAVTALPAQDQPSDDRIYDEVRQVLTFDADVRGAAIEVIVKEGAVVLRGRVRDNKGREKATRLVKKVKGVKTVENELRLFGDK